MNANIKPNPTLFVGKYKIKWSRKKNKVKCRIIDKNSVFEVRGVAKCIENDQFDMIYGMRISLLDAFENSKVKTTQKTNKNGELMPRDTSKDLLTKSQRHEIIKAFLGAYGRGICKPKDQKRVVYTQTVYNSPNLYDTLLPT